MERLIQMNSDYVKYSIVIPSLNGFDGLTVTLPYLLSIDRSDFEVVVSDNCSSDGLWEYLCSFSDPRLRIFKANKRIPHSEHLNFAYSKSKGEWIGHIGDDDLILKDRFDYLDDIVDDCDLVVGKDLRYVWPGHNIEPENSICTMELRNYSSKKRLLSGDEYYSKIINLVGVPGGGQWLVKRRVYQRVVDEFGYFSPDAANVEFFSLRASAYFSENVAIVDHPLFINGRSKKSSGSTLVKHNQDVFDWGFENPGGKWLYCPVPTYAYYTISLDAALRVENKFSSGKFSRIFWGRICMGAILNKTYGVDSSNFAPNKMLLFKSAIINYPIGAVYAVLRWLGKKIVMKLNIGHNDCKGVSRCDFSNVIGNEFYIKGECLNINNICDFADWYLMIKNREI